jgi:hypothetical protein
MDLGLMIERTALMFSHDLHQLAINCSDKLQVNKKVLPFCLKYSNILKKLIILNRCVNDIKLSMNIEKTVNMVRNANIVIANRLFEMHRSLVGKSRMPAFNMFLSSNLLTFGRYPLPLDFQLISDNDFVLENSQDLTLDKKKNKIKKLIYLSENILRSKLSQSVLPNNPGFSLQISFVLFFEILIKCITLWMMKHQTFVMMN